jgi:hypothetical protein
MKKIVVLAALALALAADTVTVITVDEQSGGGGRFNSRLLSSAAAIRLINPAVMEDLAYEYVYGVPVPREP